MKIYFQKDMSYFQHLSLLKSMCYRCVISDKRDTGQVPSDCKAGVNLEGYVMSRSSYAINGKITRKLG